MAIPRQSLRFREAKWARSIPSCRKTSTMLFSTGLSISVVIIPPAWRGHPWLKFLTTAWSPGGGQSVCTEHTSTRTTVINPLRLTLEIRGQSWLLNGALFTLSESQNLAP